MPRYKPVHRDPLLLPVVLAEQIQPGTFEFALDHLVDHELDLSALDAKFRNDETGASAYDPRVMLKIVLLASGQVGSITPIKGLPHGLTEQAIAAARQIRFEPKKINGVPVSTTVTFQYGFNIY